MPKLDFNFKFEGSLFKIVLSVLIPIILLISIGFMCSKAFSAELNQVPDGYKIVKIDSVCVEPEPCESLKSENLKLRREVDFNKARVKILEDELEDLRAQLKKPVKCPEQKVIVETKYIKETCPIEDAKIKTIEKIVEKEKIVERGGLVIGAIGAYSQDGIETSSDPNDPYAVDAHTYSSGIGGAFVNGFITERVQIGAFGMFGGINRTIGGTIGYAIK